MKSAFVRLIFFFVFAVTLPFSARAAIYPSSGGVWLVVGSRDNPNTAIAYAKQLARTLPSVSVFHSNNGWYAITLGWTSRGAGNPVKNRLISSGQIAGDSYFHSGERFLRLIWSTSGVTGTNRSRVLNATRLIIAGRGNTPRPPKTDFSFNGPGYVAGLANRHTSYLSFRTGPSTSRREMQRLKMDDEFEIIGYRGGWYNIRIPSGRTGWVYGRYVAQGEAPVRIVQPKPVEPKPEPKLVINESENGRKLLVSGLQNAGFDYLSLRKGPGAQHLEIARLREKTKLVVTGKVEGWYRVKPAPSVEGWVKSEYVTAAEVPTFGPEEKPKPKPETIDVVAKKKPEAPKATENPKAAPIGKRVALVLGNSAYKHTTALPNPKNDADKISAKLRSLGFEVVVGLDGGKVAMESSIRDFVRILPGADVALFFYAGHAMQVKGKNYLIPIDAKLSDSTALDFETIQLSSILQFVDQPGRISIALLDACRDNPLSRTFARSVSATRSAFIGRGLATPASSGNLLIGFATAPGDVALDGEGENSPFTTALLKHIETPKLEVEAMLKRVRADVFDATNQQQTPWVNSGLRREFYFKN